MPHLLRRVLVPVVRKKPRHLGKNSEIPSKIAKLILKDKTFALKERAHCYTLLRLSFR